MERRVTILGFVCALIASSLQAATFTVTTTADSGAGSLRQAIADSNANGSAVADVIEFDINAAGVQTITVLTALPDITTPVVIDGYSQDGASANTLPLASGSNAVILIALDGVDKSFPGLSFVSGSTGSTVRGLSLQRFYAGIAASAVASVSVAGNFVGLDASGTVAAGNTVGVLLGEVSSANQVGGIPPALRNVIGGNVNGVEMSSGAADNLVSGNLIGTAKDGATALGNNYGVMINGSDDNVVLDNVIAGNTGISGSAGVLIRGNSSGNAIVGNFIGTSANGLGSLPNGHGIFLTSTLLTGTPTGTIIGTAAEPNTIANNLSDGVAIEGDLSVGHTIRYNVFRNNGGLAIDLTNNGLTANDPMDEDFGSNLLQNFPVITSAVQAPDNSVTLMGTLNSMASTQFALQFHYTVTCDPSGFGEGEHVADANVTTDASGNAAFTVNIPFLPSGGNVTATATAPDGNTSEFSACAALVAGVPVSVDLSITKQGPATIPAGADVTYTITVTNPGPTAATNVVVTDDLPPSLTFVSATPTQGSCNTSDPVTCTLGGLAAGASATVTLIATASTTPGPVANTASVSATELDPNAGNNASTAAATIAPASAAANVPTLDFAGLAIIATILALGALFRLRLS